MSAYSNSRSITVSAPASAILPHLLDFRAWQRWSPWEDLDPELARTYSGAESGVGAHYDWRGNKKAGEGSMEITGADDHSVTVALEFLKPFKASNTAVFQLEPGKDATVVTWTMSGDRGLLLNILGKLFLDKAIGKDFDKGLRSLKAVAEA